MKMEQLESRRLLAGDVLDFGAQVLVLGDPVAANVITITDAENGGLDIVVDSGDGQPLQVNVEGVDGFFGQITIAGGNAADQITIDSDNYVRSTVLGGGGDDVITGGGGVDMIIAGAGNDVVDGGDNRDFLFGGLGDDTLTGGAGNDWLYDTQGVNVLTGGAGIDSYMTNAASSIVSDDDDRFFFVF